MTTATTFAPSIKNMDDTLRKIARAISREMGTQGTTTTTGLQQQGDMLFPPGFFLGVYPADERPPQPRGRAFYVQNTHAAHQPGEHWFGVACEPGHPPLLFDSFGRHPGRKFMPKLAHMEGTDPDVNQLASEDNCGQLTLAFGKVFQLYGRDVAVTI